MLMQISALLNSVFAKLYIHGKKCWPVKGNQQMKKCKSSVETGGQEGIEKIHDSTITELKKIFSAF